MEDARRVTECLEILVRQIEASHTIRLRGSIKSLIEETCTENFQPIYLSHRDLARRQQWP